MGWISALNAWGIVPKAIVAVSFCIDGNGTE